MLCSRMSAVVVLLLASSAVALPPAVRGIDFKAVSKGAPAKAALKAPVTVVVVWASWCEVCERSLPGYLAIPEPVAGKGVDVLAISADDELADAAQAAQERKYRLPIYWAPKEQLKAKLAISAVPTVIVYKGDEEALRFAGEGSANEERLRATLAQLAPKK